MSNLMQLIKTAALDAGEAAGPCAVTFGTVMTARPLQIKIDQKLILPEEFLILTSAVRDHEVTVRRGGSGPAAIIQVQNGLKEGEAVVLLRAQGGQKYIVWDRG